MDAAECKNVVLVLIFSSTSAIPSKEQPAQVEAEKSKLDQERLDQLIDLISNIKVSDEASRAKDMLSRTL